MRLKVFTLRLGDETGACDDREMVAFLEDKRVIATSEHLLHDQGAPLWAVMVTWAPASGTGKVAVGRDRTDWRTTLGEDERPVFDALREWRNAQAKRDGKPAYVLFTNRQLAAISRARPETLGALAALEGVGEARIRDYGEAALAIVARLQGTGGGEAPADEHERP